MGFLTEEQRFYLKFMHVYLKFTAEEIRNHVSLKNSDNKLHRKSTIKYWIDRIDETGDVKVKERSGRPKKLNDNEIEHLLNTIKQNSKLRYSRIRLKSKLTKVCTNTINRYGLRNGFRKFFCIY